MKLSSHLVSAQPATRNAINFTGRIERGQPSTDVSQRACYGRPQGRAPHKQINRHRWRMDGPRVDFTYLIWTDEPETLASGVKKGRPHVRISRPHRLLFAAFCDRSLLLRVLPDGAAGRDPDAHDARGHLAHLPLDQGADGAEPRQEPGSRQGDGAR